MASPVAHSLTAVIVYTLAQRRLPHWREGLIWLYVAATNLSDFDFLPGLLIGDRERFHRGFSHSLAFALLCGLLVYALMRWRRHSDPARGGMIATLLVGSHVLIDWLTRDLSLPSGIPALWPFRRDYYTAPLHPFLNVERGDLGSWSTWLHNLTGAGLEALTLSPAVIIVLWYFRKASPPERG